MGSQRENGWVDTRKVRSKLLGYKEAEREIDNQIERLERFEAKMYSVGSPQMSDMPKGSGPAGDRIAAMVVRKEELADEIRRTVKNQANERKEIENILDRMKKSDERAVIRMRYIDGLKWAEVTELLFGSREDFDDKRDSYLRRTTKLHGRALIDMAREMAQMG